MPDRLRDRWRPFVRRLRQVERRELREFRAWIERTSNLVHLSTLFFVPLLVAVVTYISNTLSALSFLLFPPLASGTHTMFSDPRGKYATPARFVAGLTAGAGCGWVALVVSTRLGRPPVGGPFDVSVVGAALAVFLAGVVTWLFDVEEPSAFSTALLGLLVPHGKQPAFLLSVLLSTVLVSVAFHAWREQFYEQRADILYQSTSGDDHVLVPMRGAHADATAMLAARLAAAHDAGKVVLLDVVENEDVARAERARLDRHDGVDLASDRPVGDGPAPTGTDESAAAATADGSSGPTPTDDPGGPAASPTVADADDATATAVADAAAALEDRAGEIQRLTDVACEVVVAVDGEDRAGTITETARETNCDLVAVPYAERLDSLAPFVRDLFAAELDVLVHRSADGRTDWSQVMVPVRRTGHVAHSMVDFALRLVGDVGSISVCHCVGPSGSLRRAEEMLADLVEPFDGPVETRVSRSDVLEFLAAHDDHYDLVFVGASRDRSSASRIVAPPTFQRTHELESDVAIVDRG